MTGGTTPLARLLSLAPIDRRWVLRGLTATQRRELDERWELWAHAGQLEPAGDWRVWLIRAGRGFGKTRAGAEWVTQIARDVPGARIALVAATIDEGRRVMVEGESGVLAVARAHEKPIWRKSAGEVTFSGGAVATLFSAERPDALRGPEHHAAWCDELAKWRYGDAAWDNLLMGLRAGGKGGRPRALVTTTPKPVALLRRVMAMRDCVETQGATADNPHLPAFYLDAITEQYRGTRWERQEIDGELIDDVDGALWTRAMIEACRVDAAPELVRVVVGVDPPASAGGDACGIVAVGAGRDGHAYVLEDASVAGERPDGWARAVARCAARWGADRVVAEKNQGGDMVEAVLRGADAGLPVTLVHASRSKGARAEPVGLKYERGRVKHVGAFAALEDELCGLMAGGGYGGPGRSPDRADALVWAVDELLLGRRGEAGMRVV